MMRREPSRAISARWRSSDEQSSCQRLLLQMRIARPRPALHELRSPWQSCEPASNARRPPATLEDTPAPAARARGRREDC